MLMKLIKIQLKKFIIKDLEKVEKYIEIEIDYNEGKGKMNLSQKKCIESLSEKYRLEKF